MPGKEMGCADGLSCSPNMDEPSAEEKAKSKKFISSIKNIHAAQLNLENIYIAQEEDKLIQELRRRVKGKTL